MLKFVLIQNCRVLFGVTSSPFLLTGTLIKHTISYENIDPTFVVKFLADLPIDDLNSGADSEKDAYKFFMNCKSKLAEASFNLRKFQSNSRSLELLVDDPDTVNHQSDKTKVLGVLWDKNADNIVFNFDDLLSSTKLVPTKRELLRFIASIFDPLGLINHFVFRLKLLFQSTCIEHFQWDDKLSGEFLKEWTLILQDL